jgi:outer membrane lipoprotein-sorting protein
MKRLLSTILALGFFCAQSSRADDITPMLDSWFAAQQQIHTWSADFIQTRTLKTLTQPLVGRGHVSFAVPNDFRWELGQPPRTIALRHDDNMYVIYPHLKRAELYPMGADSPAQLRAALSLLQAGFPRSRDEFNSQYNVLSLAQTNGNWVFTLQPKSSAARQMMSQLELGLSTNNFSLTSTRLVFADGSSLRNDFTNIVLNPPLNNKLFEWTPPSDYQVVNPLSQ